MAPFVQTRMLAHYKHPGGRPSEYKDEYCSMVIEAARTTGVSLTAFAGMIGVAGETVHRWKTAHREFSDACARAKAMRQLFWELKIGRARKGAEVTASMFALKNISPEDWRDVKHQEHLHTVAMQLTDAQLHAIAAGGVVEVGDGMTIDADPQ